MTTYKIMPGALGGTVCVPSSKSLGHRLCICAGLAGQGSVVDNIALSQDIEATNRCLAGLGITVTEVPSAYAGRMAFRYDGTGQRPHAPVELDCGESGSTLRFFIPLGALCGVPVSFRGQGKLVNRPLDPYYTIFQEQGIPYRAGEGGQLPLTVHGVLRPGKYVLPGDVSSQFVSGLLFALPLLAGDSSLEILPPLESAGYIDLTLDSLQQFGIRIRRRDPFHYEIPGNQRYQASRPVIPVEGDWSQAAFWLAAGALSSRKGVLCSGLSAASLQGDKAVLDILQGMGAKINGWQNGYRASLSPLRGRVIDAADCPDLVPVLTAAAAVAEGVTHIIRAGRLRLKECDRLAAMRTELNKLGASVVEEAEGLLITGHPEGLAGGATVDSWNDHRVAMSLAVAALVCREPVTLTGGESVAKSYPGFWSDYASVGGKVLLLE